MALKFQLRHDTAANWSSANPVLMQGEIGIDMTANKIKIGDGSTAWNSLAYALTGPTGPQGPIGSPFAALSGPPLAVVSGGSIQFTLSIKDAYTTYSVAAVNGLVSLSGTTITYTGQAVGNDTITIYAGDSTRQLTVQVVAASLGVQPDAPPALGAAHLGGFYAGAIWDTTSTSTNTVAVNTQVVTVTIQAQDLSKFYVGQPVRLAVNGNSQNGIMQGTVVGGSVDQLTLNLTSVLAGTPGASYSTWVLTVPYKVIVAPKSSGDNASVAYKTANNADPADCWTLTNGKASTAAQQALNTNPISPVYPMAQWVTNINTGGGIGGYTDWYIPARDELELLWRNLKPVTNDNNTSARSLAGTYGKDGNFPDLSNDGNGKNQNSYPLGAAYTSADPAQTAVTAFRSGGAEALDFGSSYYWCSSEYAAYGAWFQYYVTSYPGGQNASGKGYTYRARAVRRSVL